METALKVTAFAIKLLWATVVILAKIAVGLVSVVVPLLLVLLAGHSDSGGDQDSVSHRYGHGLHDGDRDLEDQWM
jgi:hypothetical protein